MARRGAWGLWAALGCGLCLLAGGQEQAGGGQPWRQLIQWENNGRVYSLLNTGAEYVPAGQERPGGNRLLLAGAVTGGTGSVRRQAPAVPPRLGSETVRGQTRHPFGFGQVPENWREGPVGDTTASQRVRPAGRPRQSSSSSSSSSFAYASVGQPPYGVPRPEPYLPARSPEMPQAVPDSQARVSVGSVYRPSHGGRGEFGGDPGPAPHTLGGASCPLGLGLRAGGTLALTLPDILSTAYTAEATDYDVRVLLRFPQRVKNQGTADFLPSRPRHSWEWHSCHQHYHSMDEFSHYDLLDATTGRKVAEGHKASFCLEDTTCDFGNLKRYACTAHTQGLSPGCYDTYNADIDCQWIDITDVQPGNYVLKVQVNPKYIVLESDFTNNVVRCNIHYTGRYVATTNCKISQ
uniref:protein-lysine 6-oxidase n=1 Tax=Otus sunia TaxID=257818 RepID=A0A8C8AYN2_9STRI